MAALLFAALPLWEQDHPPKVSAALLSPHAVQDRIVAAAGPRLAPLALAIVARESGFDPSKLSDTDDGGLFQLHRSTAAWLGVVDWLDPDQNIAGGVRLLREGFEIYGTDRGAACYFAHPARCKFETGSTE
jgi:soluble lytic murein transglycosylase-like protein